MPSIQAAGESTSYSARRALLPGGPLLVASDGSEESAPAFHVARLLAERSDTAVEVVSALEPVSIIVPEPGVAPPPVHPGASRLEERRTRLEALVTRELGDGGEWPTEIVLGGTARAIAAVARARDARLVVTGLVHHNRVERTLRRETPLGIAQAVGAPVLAVPPMMTRLPRRVVIAVGTGDAGSQLGTMASPLLGDAVAIFLVHVKPVEPLLVEREVREDDADYERGVQLTFAEIRASLRLPADVPVETVILTGRPTDSLLDFAATDNADLLVVGYSPRTLLRFAGAGMAARLLRRAPCAVLLVPAGVPDGMPAPGATDLSNEPADWPALLAAFMERNAGRPTVLEVDDESLGAQLVACDFRLTGITYDRNERTLTIMLGGGASATSHLSHRVAAPSVIAVQHHGAGRDEALVAGYEAGQALLTIR